MRVPIFRALCERWEPRTLQESLAHDLNKNLTLRRQAERRQSLNDLHRLPANRDDLPD
jgi:hypothetical protein